MNPNKKAFAKPPSEIIRSKQGRSAIQYNFPSDIAHHGMLLNFEEYKFKDSAGTMGVEMSLTDSILLPVPKELKQTYSTTYAEGELGALVGYLADKAGSGSMADFEANIQAAGMEAMGTAQEGMDKNVAAMAGKGLAAAAKMSTSAIARKLPAGVGDAVTAVTGLQTNPFAAAILKGVPLRKHTFNWALSPRNKGENETLINIVNVLRKNMLPSLQDTTTDASSGGNFFMKYPDLLNVAILGDPKTMHAYKPAVITEFTFDNSNSGDPSFFTDGSPVFYDMTLSIMETDIVTQEDIEQLISQVN
jgi:hypothetical protein